MRFGMFGLAAGDRDPVPLSMEDSIGSDTTTSSHCSDEESKEPYTPPAKRACSRPDSIEKGSSKQSNEKQDTLLEASWLGSLDAGDMVDTAAHSFHIDHDSFASALQAFDSPGFQPSSNLQDATMEDDLLWQLVAPEHGSSDDTADWLSSTPNSLPSTPSTDTLVEFPRGPSGGGVHNRKEWAAWEDEAIRAGVAELGMRWRAIAARLSGRSDDAVRNRWARLHASSNAGNCPANKSGAPSRQKREGAAETRHSWTAAEDAVIMASVAEVRPPLESHRREAAAPHRARYPQPLAPPPDASARQGKGRGREGHLQQPCGQRRVPAQRHVQEASAGRDASGNR